MNHETVVLSLKYTNLIETAETGTDTLPVGAYGCSAEVVDLYVQHIHGSQQHCAYHFSHGLIK